MSKLEIRSVDADTVFRTYTRTDRDPIRLILDLRDKQDFKKKHLLLSYNIKVATSGRTLVDSSKNTYKIKWGAEVWWNTDVVVYGAPGLKKDHPVCAFLLKEGRCRSITLLREGLPAMEKRYSFLCSSSTKAHRGLVYPSQIEPGVLYLGDWDQAEDRERLQQLQIRRVISVHNHPERLKTPASIKHMRIEAADVPTTDLTRFYNAAYEFIEEGRSAGVATLVHCGAGVSRSAALCAAHQMRKHCWNADRALRFIVDRRSKVCPNEGFWRQLCALEESLGVPARDRSDVDAPPVVDASFTQLGAVTVAAGAAGAELQVKLSGARSAAVPESGDNTRPADEEREAGEPGSKRARRGESSAALVIDISKEGVVRGKLELPVLARHQRCIFGRGPDCQVRLEHASISRQHAQLTVDANGSVRLADMGSAHGTNINGMWVKAQQFKEVQVGTQFRFGASSRTYTVKAINLSQ